MRKSRAIINLENLKTNYLRIRKKVSPSRILAVVKADAYGHGMQQVAGCLSSLESAPEYFGVALYEEGIALRRSVKTTPVLVFGPPAEDDLAACIKFRLIPTIFSGEHLQLLNKVTSKKLKVHIKVDTGMGRLGIGYKKAVTFIKQVARLNNVIIDGIYTHFATSDEKEKSFALLQLQRFNDVINECKKAGISTGLVHCANSGAILDMPEAYFDMVRPGISLYGYYPSSETTESIKLSPVMGIETEIDSVKTISSGESVSYGRKYTSTGKETIVTVPFGYADGLPRLLTNRMNALYANKIIRQAGTITMDRTAFVCTQTKVKTGDTVKLIGKSGKNKITAADWADELGTIPYEILCGISKRVPRIYTEQGKE